MHRGRERPPEAGDRAEICMCATCAQRSGGKGGAGGKTLSTFDTITIRARPSTGRAVSPDGHAFGGVCRMGWGRYARFLSCKRLERPWGLIPPIFPTWPFLGLRRLVLGYFTLVLLINARSKVVNRSIKASCKLCRSARASKASETFS